MWDSGVFLKFTSRTRQHYRSGIIKIIIQAIDGVACACEICACEIGGGGGGRWGIADCRAWLSMDIP